MNWSARGGTRGPLASVGIFLACGVLACGQPASTPADNRRAEAAAIFEESFRYGLRQFAPKAGEPASLPPCLSVVEEGVAKDPPRDMIERLGGSTMAVPGSSCRTADMASLSLGPIDWLSNSEVRVKGVFRPKASGPRSVAYRVVREGGEWRCAGPIVSYDPL